MCQQKDSPVAVPYRALLMLSITGQLERMLATHFFVIRPRMSRLLRFIVAEHLRTDGEPVDQRSIAMSAMDLPDDFHPSRNARVRTSVMRLRKSLADYYATVGCDDPVTFSVTPGPYRLVVEARASRPDSVPAGSIARGALPTLLVLEPAYLAHAQPEDGLSDQLARKIAGRLSEHFIGSAFVTATAPLARERLASLGSAAPEIGAMWGYHFVIDPMVRVEQGGALSCGVSVVSCGDGSTLCERSITLGADKTSMEDAIVAWIFHQVSDAFVTLRNLQGRPSTGILPSGEPSEHGA